VSPLTPQPWRWVAAGGSRYQPRLPGLHTAGPGGSYWASTLLVSCPDNARRVLRTLPSAPALSKAVSCAPLGATNGVRTAVSTQSSSSIDSDGPKLNDASIGATQTRPRARGAVDAQLTQRSAVHRDALVNGCVSWYTHDAVVLGHAREGRRGGAGPPRDRPCPPCTHCGC
jgi:hypothetical protein